MKIPASIRNRHQEISQLYVRLKGLVDERIRRDLHRRWHYESRVKELESYALKLETGRETKPDRPEDMFACTIVVENHARISDAVSVVTSVFKEESRRPPNARQTSLSSHSFAFDDLQLYVSWVDADSQPATGVDGIQFEVQVKTFLQHAWGIATHELIYKSDEVSWGASRVAFQVKAMLENAELSIGAAKQLTECELLDRADEQTRVLAATIAAIRDRWTEPASLPRNVQRLAQNILDLAFRLRLELDAVWQIVDAATGRGRGAKLLDLSPYGAIIDALVSANGAALFRPLMHEKNRRYVFVPGEVPLPHLSAAAKRWIITP